MKHLIAALALMATPLSAHEFWIEPEAGQVAEGAPLMAQIRVGEKLDGATYSYLPKNFRRFEIALGDRLIPVEGRLGDRPALNMAVEGEGLATVIHVTRDYDLTYDSWEKFVNFTRHKDFEWAQARHTERGFSRDKVQERYVRFGKSLIAVGDGAGSDRAFGLEVEIVALANPYVDDVTGGMPVQVIYQGKALPDAQVEVFDKAPDGTVTQRFYRTDADGRAMIDVTPGHFHLVDHVKLRDVDEGPDGPAWESLWASLTFEVAE